MHQNLLIYFRPKTNSIVEVGVILNRISDKVKRIPYTVSNPQISNWTKRCLALWVLFENFDALTVVCESCVC